MSSVLRLFHVGYVRAGFGAFPTISSPPYEAPYNTKPTILHTQLNVNHMYIRLILQRARIVQNL